MISPVIKKFNESMLTLFDDNQFGCRLKFVIELIYLFDKII